MKKIALLLALAAGCTVQPALSPEELLVVEKRQACKEVILAFCVHNEKCTATPTADCFEQAMTEGVCSGNIDSTIDQIKVCENDILAAGCTDSPESCMSLH